VLLRLGWQLVTEILGQPIGPIFTSKAVQSVSDFLTLEDGPIDCPETSVMYCRPT